MADSTVAPMLQTPAEKRQEEINQNREEYPEKQVWMCYSLIFYS